MPITVVKVCDAMCGSGKTSACINMMNEEKGRRFMFVTPFLEEVDRILAACPGFEQPEDQLSRRSKLRSVTELISEGKNIATTHELFSRFSEKTMRMIREAGYTLVLDEVIETLEVIDVHFKNSFDYKPEESLGEGHLIHMGDSQYVWSFSPSLFNSFSDAYVLTYMFSGQTMKSFFEMYDIKYEIIGVCRRPEGYRFCSVGEMNRARDYISKIHILENEKLNCIGNKRSAYSATNVKSRSVETDTFVDKTRKNLRNVFANIFKCRRDETMWSSYKAIADRVSPCGYKGSFVPFNQRASNKYSRCRYLAYCANVFLHPAEAHYYSSRGAPVNADMYALSVLIQWVFRSAIRNGEEIWIYIPSSRMRYLFKEWLKNIAAGEDLKVISYQSGAEQTTEKVKPAKRGRPKKRGRKKSTTQKTGKDNLIGI